MMYVDSNIFIFTFLGETKKAEVCKSVLLKIADNQVAACTSALTWDEIVWVSRKHLGIQDSYEEGEKFLEFPYLRLVSTSEIVVMMAQDLMVKYNLKPRDALHAAAALSEGAKEIISDDADFDAVKELKRIPPEKFR